MKRLADIRSGEHRTVVGGFLALLSILAGHTLLETARDALFLAQVPATRLPWTYLGIAMLALGIFALQQKRGRFSVQRAAMIRWLLYSSVVSLGFWSIGDSAPDFVLYALYIWTGLFATVVVLRFWTLLGEYFSIRQAKRLYGVIGAGSVIGSIAGSAAARVIVEVGPPRTLLLAAAIAIAGGAVAVARLLPPRPAAEPILERRRLLDPLRTIVQGPYLRRVGAIVLLSTIVFTLVDYLFKSMMAAQFPPERLAAAFASAYLGFNLASLVVQLLLVRYLAALSRRLRIHQLLSVVPALLGAAAALVLAGGGIVAATALKGVDGALRHSLHRTTSEMLYVHLVTGMRSVVKGWIDVVGQRGGQALASFFILAFGMAGVSPVVLAGFVVLLAGFWIYTASSITPHYLQLFRRTLSQDSIESRVAYPELDVSSLTALLRALNSRDDGEVLAAIDILEEQSRTDVLPGLILFHPSSRVVQRALALFTREGREDILPILDRLVSHEDSEARAAALRARAWLSPEAGLYAAMIEDPSPIVSATARIGIISLFGGPDAFGELIDLVRESNEETRIGIARAIRYSPGAAYADTLIALCEHGSLTVKREAALAMREVRSTKCIEALVRMLAYRDLREPARAALVATGSEALLALEEYMVNPWFDLHIRRHLPRTILRFRTQQALDILQSRLLDEPDRIVLHKILRALGRLCADDPTLVLDRSRLEQYLERELCAAFQALDWEIRLEEGSRDDPSRSTDTQELLRGWVGHRGELARDGITRVLGLLHPNEDLREISRGLESSRRDMRASSRELLENLLAPPVRDPLLALVDDLPPRARLAQAGPYGPRGQYAKAGMVRDQLASTVPRGSEQAKAGPSLDEPVSNLPHGSEALSDYARLLIDLLGVDDVGARCLVAAHVGEIGLRELIPALEALPSDPAGFVSEAVAKAMVRLRDSEGVPR